MSINITLYRVIVNKIGLLQNKFFMLSESWANCVKDIADRHTIDNPDVCIPPGAKSQLRPKRQRQRPLPALRPHQREQVRPPASECDSLS